VQYGYYPDTLFGFSHLPLVLILRKLGIYRLAIFKATVYQSTSYIHGDSKVYVITSIVHVNLKKSAFRPVFEIPNHN
jgi:hypothetical protein